MGRLRCRLDDAPRLSGCWCWRASSLGQRPRSTLTNPTLTEAPRNRSCLLVRDYFLKNFRFHGCVAGFKILLSIGFPRTLTTRYTKGYSANRYFSGGRKRPLECGQPATNGAESLVRRPRCG